MHAGTYTYTHARVIGASPMYNSGRGNLQGRTLKLARFHIVCIVKLYEQH